MLAFKLTDFTPKPMITFLRVIKRKWLKLLAIRGSKVSVVNIFTDIYAGYHRFLVDPFNFFRFIRRHGYAPLLIFVNQLAIGLDQYEYSHFSIPATLPGI
jgi:hypothetical protein